jgi:hypothetical protein
VIAADLGSVTGREIAIMRPELAAPAYELRGGRRLLGRLQRRGRVSRVMVGEAADGYWTFREAGHPYPRFTAEAEGERRPVALLDTATEVLTLSDGRTLRWGASPREPEWSALVADPEIELMRFQPRVVGSRRGELVIDPVAGNAPEVVSVLALLGAYRVILAAEREPARSSRKAG